MSVVHHTRSYIFVSVCPPRKASFIFVSVLSKAEIRWHEGFFYSHTLRILHYTALQCTALHPPPRYTRSCDADRLDIAKNELGAMLEEEELASAILLVFANKQVRERVCVCVCVNFTVSHITMKSFTLRLTP